MLEALVAIAIAVISLQFTMLGWLLREVWGVKVEVVAIKTALKIHLGAQWPGTPD